MSSQRGLSVRPDHSVHFVLNTRKLINAAASYTSSVTTFRGRGDGDGDFFDKLSGCCESAISTCNSIILGVVRRVEFGDTGDLDCGGAGDVEWGDWEWMYTREKSVCIGGVLLAGCCMCWRDVVVITLVAHAGCSKEFVLYGQAVGAAVTKGEAAGSPRMI